MNNSVDFSSATLKFSVSGLRGLYPNDLHPDNIVDMVYAFADVLTAAENNSKEVALARDTRPSGVAIYHLACGVLTACGYNVHLLGIVPTPTIKAYVHTKNLAGGIMVSASHNPMQYNAFKFIKAKGFFFEEADNKKWQSLLSDGEKKHEWNVYQDQGKVFENTDAEPLHIQQVIDSVFPDGVPDLSFLKVAIDPVGACASQIIPALLEKLKVRYVAVNGKFSAEFPRKAEPTPDALEDLSALVVQEKCDVGFAFDPDADRLALLDEQGSPLGEEYTLPLILSAALQEKTQKDKKASCVVNLSSSWLNRYVCDENNCSLFLSAVGEANVVAEMIKQNAVFGGEGNGGVIDPNVSSMGRDSLSGVAWILRRLAAEKQKLSVLKQNLPQVFMKKLAIQMDADALKNIAQKMQERFVDMKMDTRDGYHFSTEKGIPWIHLRASNTEPIVRLISESENYEQEKSILHALQNLGLSIKS